MGCWFWGLGLGFGVGFRGFELRASKVWGLRRWKPEKPKTVALAPPPPPPPPESPSLGLLRQHDGQESGEGPLLVVTGSCRLGRLQGLGLGVVEFRDPAQMLLGHVVRHGCKSEDLTGSLSLA